MANAKSVSKAELIDTIATETGVSKKDVKAVVDSMMNQVSNRLSEGSKVQLTGFGTFEVRDRQARTGVRPGTTEQIQIPASKQPAFKAGKGLKDKLNS
jgi:DNA-binding protein HU-beta